jgi:2-polyprenyl-3-methyl-5-hydroxy-6-metoxy-1,4-benzoquinol methylase
MKSGNTDEHKVHFDPKWVADYFDEFGMKEWERLTATVVNEVNFHVHSHYLEHYVPRGSSVLEIGAGAGRFTQILATLTDSITVGDISRVQLELNEKHAIQYGFDGAVDCWHEMDICDMSVLSDAAFDVVVAYGGPFSYALDKRFEAIRECVRILKPGGILAASVMSMWGGARHKLRGVTAIPPAQNRKIVASGDVLPGSFEGAQHYYHMFRAREFSDFLTGSGLRIEALSAAVCLSVEQESVLEGIRDDAERWQSLLDMELESCAEPGALDLGPHIIGVGCKVT